MNAARSDRSGGVQLSIRDPFYTQIEEALGTRNLDDALFEQLAAELVEAKDFPTNIAAGGADNGYDFELLDTASEPGPGVVTTSDRVTPNLKRNLERNRSNCPRAAKKTYVVTSSVLTSRKRDNLKKAASELGYTCLGASDRYEVARYIYRQPQWARDLLGLTGQPSGLSIVPRSSRPLTDTPLVGREGVISRLRSLGGDALLVGSPGSGKTALLARLAVDGDCAFMVTSDMTAVANAIRQQQPSAIAIDDPVDAAGATRDLMQLRSSIGADFRIIVTDWGANPELQQMLGLSDSDIVTLERLTRDEIVAVIDAVGVRGPRPLVREIVDQAEGVPGLAVTLAQAALSGDALALMNGSRLGTLMESTVKRLLGNPRDGDQAILALGAIALSGDAGLTVEEAAGYLGVSKLELQGLLKSLTSGGIIRSDRRRVSLRPRPLRRHMIREAFFGPVPMDCTPLLELTPDRGATAKELVLADRAGATIPNLLETVTASGSIEAARYFAGSGPRQARALLAAAPALAVDVAMPALHTAPATVIPLLLTSAVGDQRELHSTPTHPLRLIKDWGNAGLPGRGEVMPRKRATVESALSWWKNGGDFDTACWACLAVLGTTFENTDMDAGAGRTLFMTSGMLTPDEIAQLEPLWSELLAAIKKAGSAPWPRLLSACWELVHPYLSGGGEPRDAVEASRRLGATVIEALGDLAATHPGALDRLNTMRRHLGHEHFYAIPHDYAVLFGEHDGEDWERAEREKTEQMSVLADEWAGGSPSDFAVRLNWLQQEAGMAGGGHLDRSTGLCRLLAERVEDPQLWLKLLAQAKVQSSCLLPFLSRATQADADDAEALILPILNDPTLELAAVEVALQPPGVSDGMWSALGPRLVRYPQTVQILCLRKEVPVETLGRLLAHDSPEVTHAVAVGMWNGNPHGSIPSELEQSWEEAVVAINDDEYWLKEMLQADPGLGARWIEARIRHDDWQALMNRENVDVAVAGLDVDERLAMLHDLPAQLFREDVVSALIGDSEAVYRQVLADRTPESHWEAPLQRPADETWRRLAVIALTERSPQEVAQASLLRRDGWSGEYSEHLRSQINDWARWLDDPHEGIREVAKLMVDLLSTRRSQALAEEHEEAVEGFR